MLTLFKNLNGINSLSLNYFNFLPSIFKFSSINSKKSFNPIPNRVMFKKFQHKSVYRRKEPSLGINFLSDKSKQLLKECIEENTANPFFEIIDQYKVQDFPSFCGLTNLTITLNALKIDPKIKWKGIWRWYDEYNTKCINIENIYDYGMTLPEFKQILKCNNVESKMYRPNKIESSVDLSLFKTNTDNKNSLYMDDLSSNKYSCIKHNSNCLYKKDRFIKYQIADFNFFKSAVLSSTFFNNFILMTSLSRKTLNQTGDGHFAPIVSFHKRSQMGLLLEVAKFKYDSRWYHINDIYKALFGMDTFTNKTRGFFIIKKKPSKRIKININIEELKEKIKKENLFKIDENKKAKLINFLVLNQFTINGFNSNNINRNDHVYSELKEILLPIYKQNKEFKEMTDIIYMFDNDEFIFNLIGVLYYFLQ